MGALMLLQTSISAHKKYRSGTPKALDHPVSSFDTSRCSYPQAHGTKAARTNQDDRGRIGLLGLGTSWTIHPEKNISFRRRSATQIYVITDLILITWPYESEMDLNDIKQAWHTLLGQAASSSPAVSRDWTNVEHPEADREAHTGPDQYRIAVHKSPLTRRGRRHTFARKPQPRCSQNHSTRRSRAPPRWWVERAWLRDTHTNSTHLENNVEEDEKTKRPHLRLHGLVPGCEV